MGNEQHDMNGRIQLVLDSAPMSVTIYDDNYAIIDCNMEAVKLFGLSTKEEFIKALNERYHDFFPPFQPCRTKTTDKLKWLFEQATTNGRVQLEWMHLTADGQELPTSVTFVRVEYKDSFMLVAYVNDLREVKAAQAKEREALEFGNTLYDISPVFVDVWDENINLIDCNNQALSLFGVSSKEEFIRRVDDFFPEYQPCGTPTKEKYRRYFQQALDEGHVRFEFMHLDGNGDELPVETIYVRITRQGKPVLVGFNHDLRQLKKAQQLEVAEESSKAKSRFLARMSHEIRTPITAVLGITEIHLRNQVMPPHTEEAFAKIYDSSKTLLSIVNDILDFSKIESGKMPLINNEYDVASLVSDAGQLHLVYLDSKDVTFKMNVDAQLPAKIIGDALRIRQIINNLLTNAFKYTEHGMVELSLKCETKKDNDVILVISIQDTGVGMTQEQIEELEDLNSEYVRLHEQEKPFVSGTGLGLPIVYSLVQMMDAQFNLTSEVNKGTNINICIPQKISGTEILGAELAHSLQNFESSTWTKTLTFTPESMPYGKVLVVDDVDSNLYVAEAMLESFDLNIELCESGQDAIDKIRQGKIYDIIFLDHMMPGIDGMETAKILRGMDYNHPIVALTANALKGQAELFMNNGFSGFMSKPLDINRLNSYLVRFIKDKHGDA